jgi:hypothetical protein
MGIPSTKRINKPTKEEEKVAKSALVNWVVSNRQKSGRQYHGAERERAASATPMVKEWVVP